MVALAAEMFIFTPTCTSLSPDEETVKLRCYSMILTEHKTQGIRRQAHLWLIGTDSTGSARAAMTAEAKALF